MEIVKRDEGDVPVREVLIADCGELPKDADSVAGSREVLYIFGISWQLPKFSQCFL